MKIQCQSCQAKYTIADEKVLGKVVKIRCKKCSATIVINGNEARSVEDNADTHVFDYASQSTEQWTVNVADGDQRTMTVGEIVAEYKAGVVNDETFCWKDGMADWLPLREIEQLYGAASLGPRPSLSDDISVPPQVSPAAALFAPADGGDSLFSGGSSPPPHANGNGNGNGNGGGAGASLFGGSDPAPAAARRAAGRGQGADLFGNAATAGGEEDVMTSAAAGAAAAAANDKLTGQRNENSVLFSLSALTEPGKGPENKTTATADGSGLIDIRALSATMGDGEKKDKGSRVDDIMNLSGGGAFGAALAAPILAPPPIETIDHGAATAANSGNKTMLFGMLGAAAIVAIGIVVAVVMVKGGDDKKDAKDKNPSTSVSVAMNDPAAPGATGATGAAPAGGGTAAPADSAAAGGGDTATAPGSGAAKPGTGAAKPAAGGGGATAAKPAAGGGAAAAPAGAAPDAPKPAEPAKPAQPASFGDALAAAAGRPKDAPAAAGGGGGATAPFDRGAAAAALGGVNVQACKKPDGPTGGGHVKVTFAPDGSVSSAVVDGGPFPGTPVGGCIAGKYRGARVPAFSGAPVSVGKSFTLN